MRALLYFKMVMVENEEIQRRGVVEIAMSFGQPDLSIDRVRKINHVQNALPIKYASFHACCNSWIMNTFFSLGDALPTSRHRVKFRHHYGKLIPSQ